MQLPLSKAKIVCQRIHLVLLNSLSMKLLSNNLSQHINGAFVNAKSWSSVFFLALFLTACSGGDNASIELSGLNYTNTWITAFSVDSYGGHGIEPNGGGGAFVCCVTIPRKWHAGMKVTVRWTGDERIPDSWKERVVEIPKYTKEDMGAFAVHFYPDDTVKVLVTAKTVGHPDYPYPRPK